MAETGEEFEEEITRMTVPAPAPAPTPAPIPNAEDKPEHYWPETIAGLFVAVIMSLIVAALLRTHGTVVVVRDVSKGSVIGADDVVVARLPQLDAALTTTREAVGLVAAADLIGGMALRRKHVLRQQAVTTAAVHRGDAMSSANVAFKITPYVPDAMVSTADLGRAANTSIPAGTIVRQPMLARDASIGVALRDLVPFKALDVRDVRFDGQPPLPAVAVRSIGAGSRVRASDLVTVRPEDAAKAVVSYRVVTGPMYPRPGTAVRLMRGGKDGPGEAVPATLLALRSDGDAATVVVALEPAAAAKLAEAAAEPIRLVQTLGGS